MDTMTTYFPPPALWGLDNLFWTHVKMFISEIKLLRKSIDSDSNNVFFISNHPLRFFEIQGIITNAVLKTNFISFTVDDSTDTMPAFLWLNDDLESKRMKQMSVCEISEKYVGQLVTMRGKVKDFRDLRQMDVNEIVIERDPNAETLHYLQCMKLKTRVYDVEQVYDPALIKISPDLKQILCLDAVIEDETLENDDEEEDSIEALINEISDEKRFYLVLKKAIKMAKIQSFTLDFVLQMPAVELGAQKFLSESAALKDEEQQLVEFKSFVKKAMVMLVNHGFVYLSDPLSEQYSLITDQQIIDTILHMFELKKEENLNRISTGKGQLDIPEDVQQLLMRSKFPKQAFLFQSRQMNNSCIDVTVTEKEAVDGVKSVLKFKHMTRNAITKCLEEMVKQNIIYESAYREFKLV